MAGRSGRGGAAGWKLTCVVLPVLLATACGHGGGTNTSSNQQYPTGRTGASVATSAPPVTAAASVTVPSTPPASTSGSAAVESLGGQGVIGTIGAEPGVVTFVCLGGGNAELLQWNDDSGALSGTYRSSYLQGQPPHETVESKSTGLSGSLNGTQVTLDIGLSQPLYGSVSSDTLTLNVPQLDGSLQASGCAREPLSVWNQTVAALHAQADGDDGQAQQAQQLASQQAAQSQAIAAHSEAVSQAQQALAADIGPELPKLS